MLLGRRGSKEEYSQYACDNVDDPALTPYVNTLFLSMMCLAVFSNNTETAICNSSCTNSNTAWLLT